MTSNYELDYPVEKVWTACLHVINEIPNKGNLISVPEVKMFYIELKNFPLKYERLADMPISFNVSLTVKNNKTIICLNSETFALQGLLGINGYCLNAIAKFMQLLVEKLKVLR